MYLVLWPIENKIGRKSVKRILESRSKHLGLPDFAGNGRGPRHRSWRVDFIVGVRSIQERLPTHWKTRTLQDQAWVAIQRCPASTWGSHMVNIKTAMKQKWFSKLLLNSKIFWAIWSFAHYWKLLHDKPHRNISLILLWNKWKSTFGIT